MLDKINIPLGREMTFEEKMDPRMIRLIRSEKEELAKDPHLIDTLKRLRSYYGDEINCTEIINRLIGGRHRCPQCGGTGQVEEKIWVTDHWDGHDEIRVKQCPLCHGAGYTEDEYVPNMVQQGWKVKDKH